MGQASVLNPIIVVGRIGAPYGVKGWAHIQSFTEPFSNILSYQHWYLKVSNEWRAVKREARVQGNGLVAHFQGYEVREAIAKLVHQEIGVRRDEFSSLDEGDYYWSDLIGLKVLTTTDILLGVVKSLLETGSNDVLVIQGEEKEHLVPYVPGEYVLEVNLTTGIIRVSWDPEF
jgi:16S rRNA processing protein RimM